LEKWYKDGAPPHWRSQSEIQFHLFCYISTTHTFFCQGFQDSRGICSVSGGIIGVWAPFEAPVGFGLRAVSGQLLWNECVFIGKSNKSEFLPYWGRIQTRAIPYIALILFLLYLILFFQ
jgi:hypothetical protein